MTATILTSSVLKELLDGKNEYEVEAGYSVRDTLLKLNINPELVALVIVAGVQRSKDYIIQEKDVLKVMAIIGGG